jgi:hypothetical protein
MAPNPWSARLRAASKEPYPTMVVHEQSATALPVEVTARTMSFPWW